MPPRMLRHHSLHQASCHGQPHPYRKSAVATPFINLCLKYSLGASPRPGVLRGSPHPEPNELPFSDTWHGSLTSLIVLRGSLWYPLCPCLETQSVTKPRHSRLMRSPDKTASKPCGEFHPLPSLIRWPRAWESKVGGVRSVERVPRWLCRLCGQLDTTVGGPWREGVALQGG